MSLSPHEQAVADVRKWIALRREGWLKGNNSTSAQAARNEINTVEEILNRHVATSLESPVVIYFTQGESD